MSLTSDMKREGWGKVAGKVSAVSGGEVRTAKAVKKNWTDMASSFKRRKASRRREMNMTWGGEHELLGEDLSGVQQRVVGM